MKLTRLACLVVMSTSFACGGGGGDDDDGGTTGPPPPPPGGGGQTLGSITTSVSSLTLIAGSTQTITVKTTPGANVQVEQLRHEFWFGATLPGSIRYS